MAAAVALALALVVAANAAVLLGGSSSSAGGGSSAPVALVLGAGLRADGSPSLMLQDRLDAAAALYRRGRVHTILASGDHGTRTHDEANAMRRGLEARGVAPQDVFTDHAGFDTWSSMVRARKVFHATQEVVVTQRFHLARATWVARRAGLRAEGVAADGHPYGRAGRLAGAREVVARVKAVADVLERRRPRYLGPPIDLGGDGRVTAG